MTRFARAKGSKSCNVKQPEDPTSWAEMKQAMQAQFAKKEDYSSAKSALDSVKNQKKIENKPAVWGTLGHGTDGDATDALGFLKAQLKKRKEKNNNVNDVGTVNNGKVDDFKKKKKKKQELESEGKLKKGKKSEVEVIEGNLENKKKSKKRKADDDNSNQESIKISENGIGEIKEKKKKDRKRKVDDIISNQESIKVSENGIRGVEEKLKRKKKDKKNKNDETKEENKNEEVINGDIDKKGKKRKNNVEENLGNDTKINEEVPVKKKKRKPKKKKGGSNSSPEENSDSTPKKGKKRKSDDSQDNGENSSPAEKKPKKTENETNNNPNKKSKNFLKRQARKNKFEQMKLKRNQKREQLKDLPPSERRRKPLPETQEAFINGETVKLQMFDGFWVTQEDAERLTKLKNDMISKSIPLKDINGAIKLERRRAEKSLARLKKRVCFQCRKFGHELSECPEIIESHNRASNVCYKCGSTEHTAYVCKVSHGDQFRFAECFICKEQGHISKQCPDNPRGLYPKGGACNVCGDVTHLKKDCPRLMTQKEESAVTVGVRDDRMIEDLDEQLGEIKSDVAKSNVKKNKHIKF